MPSEDSDVDGVIGDEVPQQIKPRDHHGKFVPTNRAPEPMFGLRPIEGDPDTGDTSDGGDDARLRARERDVADGNEQGRKPAPNTQNLRRPAADSDDDFAAYDEEPERIDSASESAPSDEAADESDEGPKYEIAVDGNVIHVTFGEMRDGYVRQQTFHKRMADLNNFQSNLEAADANLQKGWQLWHKARQDYEEDLAALIPKEPNWDEAFARDPQGAHSQLKIYQSIYSKLAQSRQARADREAVDCAEANRQLEKYAVEGFSRFVAMHPKIFPDEPTLKKNIQSMRRTAEAAGFSELEIATTYDPRMLTILLKASKYDRIRASQLRLAAPEQGRVLRPGSATPLNGNAPRKGLEEALRRQASSGRLDDTAHVFSHLL